MKSFRWHNTHAASHRGSSGNAREGVALGARPRELLKVRKILNIATTRLLHQEEHSLAVLVLAGVGFLFVGSKVCVVHESGVFAQVTHQRDQ